MNFSRARRPEPIVDVTPLIDIIFQLVLFFMVSTTFVSAPGIEVDLPKSSSDTVLREQDELSIWIAVDGFLLLSIFLQRHRLILWLRSRCCCFFDFFLFLVILRLLVLVVGLWLCPSLRVPELMNGLLNWGLVGHVCQQRSQILQRPRQVTLPPTPTKATSK